MAEYMLAVVCLVLGILAAAAGLRVRELSEALERERNLTRCENEQRKLFWEKMVEIEKRDAANRANDWIRWYWSCSCFDRLIVRAMIRRSLHAYPWDVVDAHSWEEGDD